MTTAIENPDNNNERLLERIQESIVVGGAQALAPYFLTDLINLEDGYDIVPDHTNGTYKLYVVATADDTGAISYIWKRNNIDENYNNSDAWDEITDKSSFGTEKVEVTEDELKAFNYILPSKRIYHTGTDGENTRKLTSSEYNLQEYYIDKNQPVPTIYEERAYLIVKEYGNYRAEARNRLFNSLTKKNSNFVTFKRPDRIEMLPDNPTGHILETESATLTPEYKEATGDYAYQWYRSEGDSLSRKVEISELPQGAQISYGNETVRILLPSDSSVYYQQAVGEDEEQKGIFYMTVKMFGPRTATGIRYGSGGLNGIEDPTVSPELISLNVSSNGGIDEYGRKYYIRQDPIAIYENGHWKPFTNTGRKYAIEWYNENEEKIDFSIIKVQLTDDENYEPLGEYQEIENARSQSYTAEMPGYYQLVVTRTRNRATTEGNSVEYRVTNPPMTPVLTDDMYVGSKVIALSDLTLGLEDLRLTWKTENLEADGFEVQWYLSHRNEGSDEYTDILIFEQELVGSAFSESIFNPTDEKFNEIYNQAGANREGLYYAIVATKLNNKISAFTQKPELTDMIVVMD